MAVNAHVWFFRFWHTFLLFKYSHYTLITLKLFICLFVIRRRRRAPIIKIWRGLRSGGKDLVKKNSYSQMQGSLHPIQSICDCESHIVYPNWLAWAYGSPMENPMEKKCVNVEKSNVCSLPLFEYLTPVWLLICWIKLHSIIHRDSLSARPTFDALCVHSNSY